MQCENAYIKPGVRGILCRKCEEPKGGDLKATAHALCGHQRFCPNARCYMMLPGWEKCTRREKGTTPQSPTATAPIAQGSQVREEAAGEEMPVKKTKRTAKKKSSEKGADGE